MKMTKLRKRICGNAVKESGKHKASVTLSNLDLSRAGEQTLCSRAFSLDPGAVW